MSLRWLLTRTPMGDLPLPAEVRAKLQQAGAGRDLIMGIRPEHLKDAALVGAEEQPNGLTFSMVVDVLEWLGSEELAYFRVQGARASARELEKLAADSGSTDVPQSGDQLVARLDPASRAREGEKLELWVDPHKAQLFNPQNGATSPLSDPPTPVELAGGGSMRTAWRRALGTASARPLARCAKTATAEGTNRCAASGAPRHFRHGSWSSKVVWPSVG